MKELIKQLTPSFLLKVLKKSIISRPPRIYRSLDDAVAACSKGAYEYDDIVRVVIEKNIIYKQKIELNPIFELGTLRTLIGLGLANDQARLNVLDFGGGGGYHYTIANVALGNSNNIRWNVVETTAMANEGKRMANDKLKFFDNIKEAKNDLGSVDLVFTSGALQYCPDPLQYLKQLIEVGANRIFITRTAFNDSPKTLISTQVSKLSSNGPGPLPQGFKDQVVSYPITYASKYEAERLLNAKYHIRFMIKEDEGAYIARTGKIHTYGYFCELKTS